jgi:integrase
MGKRARGNGGVYRVPNSRFWWISYQLNGKLVRESSGCLTKTAAANKLKERLLAIGNGNFLGPRIEKITVDELYDDLLQDYRIKGQTVEWAERVWNVHLKHSFGGMKAAYLGTNQITAYVEKRMGERAAKSTINRELALLRRAFTIGFDAEPQKVARIPKFHKHIVSEKGNERRGFVEEAQYRKLKEAAAGQLWLRGLLALGYTFGFRKAELLEMRCKQVDLLNNTVSLYSGETKNGEGRTVTLTEECRLLVTELWRGKQPDDFLFTRNGEPVRDFRGAWDALVKAAGVPALLFHDLRRSAVRNMVRRGVPQKTAREISGHKTDSVFSRYNIVSEADIADAARKIEEGAKAAVSGSIHSSFIVEPENDSDAGKEKPRSRVQSVS